MMYLGRIRSHKSWGMALLLAIALTGCAAAPSARTTALPSKVGHVTIEMPSTAPDHSHAKIPVLSTDIALGPVDAKVTIVVFVDYQCPFCERVRPTLQQLMRRYGNELRLVIKNNPLPFHEHAYEAALAATTVRALAGNPAAARFFELALSEQSHLTRENLERWASEVGVASVVYREAMESRRFAERVDTDIDLAKRIGASGTPSFWINGIRLDGSQPIEQFTTVIDAQIGEAITLLSTNVRPGEVYLTLTERNVALETERKPSREGRVGDEIDKTVWKVPVYSDDPQLGPSNAKVTVTVFSDFECPFCAKVEDTLLALRERYGDQVRIVWKDNPLAFHPSARKAATLGRLVYQKHGNAEFWRLHRTLFARQDELSNCLLEQAKTFGISELQLSRAQTQGQAAQKIEQSQELADTVAARGTPHFFINGMRLSGAQPTETFQARIDVALAEAEAQLAAGVKAAKLYESLIKNAKANDDFETKNVPRGPLARPAKGPATAKVTLQLFSDFQCPFCKRIETTIDELVKEYPKDLKVVWRHLPLPFHEHAMLAAEAAEAVFVQKGAAAFWKFHDEIFVLQETESGLTRENLEQVAQKLGVDPVSFRKALDEGLYRKVVEADIEAANSAGISGTPASVINGYFVSGAQPTVAFRRAIRRALRDVNASTQAK